VTGAALTVSAQDLDLMARTVWGEARGEGEAGQVAVAWVIRNRLARPRRFRPTIAGICLQPLQFSCWNADDPNRPKLDRLSADTPGFAAITAIARDVLAGARPDPTQGAQFYYSSAAVPSWAEGHRPCAEIAAFKFFNDVA
jgi:spore germination cell wall hydrolase CwlJ-like protein